MSEPIGTSRSARNDAPWMENALCQREAVDPEIFFPPPKSTGREAKLFCRNCDVSLDCLQYALDNEIPCGVWGGLSEAERRRMRRIKAPTESHLCGTNSGADRHYRRFEVMCEPCRAARQEDSRRRRAESISLRVVRGQR